MMFSSDQKLQVSGSMDQLEFALHFALCYSGNAKNMTPRERERGCKLLYQVTDNGKYCIGWGFCEIPDGWKEYSFDFDEGIVARIIVQHLYKQQYPDSALDWADGSTDKGFLMKGFAELYGEEYEGIKNKFYGIVLFEPFTNFYAK